ncbi:hypothetical protein K474DRAFT_971986, partial [Panus rudis PR-1116 ss-1]
MSQTHTVTTQTSRIPINRNTRNSRAAAAGAPRSATLETIEETAERREQVRTPPRNRFDPSNIPLPTTPMTPNLEQIQRRFYQEPSASNPGRTQPARLNIPSYRRATSPPGDEPGNGGSNQFEEDRDNNPFFGGNGGNGGGGGGDPGDDDDDDGSDPGDGDGGGGNNPGSDDEDDDRILNALNAITTAIGTQNRRP